MYCSHVYQKYENSFPCKTLDMNILSSFNIVVPNQKLSKCPTSINYCMIKKVRCICAIEHYSGITCY